MLIIGEQGPVFTIRWSGLEARPGDRIAMPQFLKGRLPDSEDCEILALDREQRLLLLRAPARGGDRYGATDYLPEELPAVTVVLRVLSESWERHTTKFRVLLICPEPELTRFRERRGKEEEAAAKDRQRQAEQQAEEFKQMQRELERKRQENDAIWRELEEQQEQRREFRRKWMKPISLYAALVQARQRGGTHVIEGECEEAIDDILGSSGAAGGLAPSATIISDYSAGEKARMEDRQASDPDILVCRIFVRRRGSLYDMAESELRVVRNEQ